MTFRQAVEKTHGLRSACRNGLQAIRARDKGKITCRNGNHVTGSVNIDTTLKKEWPNAPRWDYAIGMSAGSKPQHIVWIEVHPASSSDVKNVLAKLRWLRTWLHTIAHRLERMEGRTVWVASGPVAIQKGSPQHRQLAAQGLRSPRSHIVLEDVWID